MNKELIKEKIQAFLKQHKLCVISTIDIGGKKPESAVIAFSENENLEIVFGTSSLSRKYKNIQKNNHVSLVIGWSSELGTIQYEGIAKELSTKETAQYATLLVSKNPDSQKFANREDQRYFLVKPTWIRFLDNSNISPKTYEITTDF